MNKNITTEIQKFKKILDKSYLETNAGQQFFVFNIDELLELARRIDDCDLMTADLITALKEAAKDE